MRVLVTGSNGLIGSEAARDFCAEGHQVYGVDNNFRKEFFGPNGSTENVRQWLENTYPNYVHTALDIRDQRAIEGLISEVQPEAIIHCAAQPSHDLAARIPHLDFSVNALGTLNLLEAARKFSPDAVVIHMSTNKVYGDRPNTLNLVESDKRFDFAEPSLRNGIDETLSIDQSTHSLFGCSKTAADLLAQEYGKNFGLKVGVFRGGCLTGPQHSGVELHGFLSYIVKCALTGQKYTIYGYQGKQVRDQIHSKDVIQAFREFIAKPRCGEVYNLGGGRKNSASILEVIDLIEDISGIRLEYEISSDHRVGDHICYYTDMRKFSNHFPGWKIQYSLDEIISEMLTKGSSVAL